MAQSVMQPSDWDAYIKQYNDKLAEYNKTYGITTPDPAKTVTSSPLTGGTLSGVVRNAIPNQKDWELNQLAQNPEQAAQPGEFSGYDLTRSVISRGTFRPGISGQQKADFDYLKKMYEYATEAYGHHTDRHEQNNRIRKALGLPAVADVNTYAPAPVAPTTGVEEIPAAQKQDSTLGAMTAPNSVIARTMLRRQQGTNTVLSGG